LHVWLETDCRGSNQSIPTAGHFHTPTSCSVLCCIYPPLANAEFVHTTHDQGNIESAGNSFPQISDAGLQGVV
jgi:hypothetical protein